MTASSARIPGLAHGWEGAAWTTLQRVAAGLTAARASFFDRLAPSLDVAVDADRDAGPAALIGIGGAVMVAASAAELDRRFAPIARRLARRWAAASCDATKDDVMLGHPGALLAIAELRDRCPSFHVPRGLVARCYARTLAAIRRRLDRDAPHFLGLAHGLAGLLLAAEHGAVRLGQRRDPTLVARAIDRLARTRIVVPRFGTVWSATSEQRVDAIARGWCHGTPGIALALSGCHRLTGDAAYEELFAGAAATVRATRSTDRTFCCGRAGRAQILIELYRQRGDRRWLTAARAVAAQAAPARLSREHPDGFSQGKLGVAYLDARLATPALPLPATGFGSYPS